jgi:dienelactone hydrolase
MKGVTDMFDKNEKDVNVVKRKKALKRILSILPKNKVWEDWLEESGELPPVFDALPSIPNLPDPLMIEKNGRIYPIKKKEQWMVQRRNLLKLIQFYTAGTVPPPPRNLSTKEVKTTKEDDVTIKNVLLGFGPGCKAELSLELMIPKGKGPFPVFMTQHNHRAWALIALSRGYIGCVYAGADSKDDTRSFIDAWPEHDWTKQTRRAWAAGRCIDYLSNIPKVDISRIGLTGHSRNGKQSLLATALDQRISAVISSSSGAGGACTWRFFSESHLGEGIEFITRSWSENGIVHPDYFHPRLRFFSSKEYKLPIDQHDILALIAPRPCLLSTALNDGCESTWAIQQTYIAAKRVYKFLGSENSLNILWRNGGHETRAEDIERYLDWFDNQFKGKKNAFPEILLHPTLRDWERHNITIDPTDYPKNESYNLLYNEKREEIQNIKDWEIKREDIKKNIFWGLGNPPLAAKNPATRQEWGRTGGEARHLSMMLERFNISKGISKVSLHFSNYVACDIYYPSEAETNGKKIPAVIWLHPHLFSGGYTAAYKRGEHIHLTLAKAGFAVFAYDQIGYGTRIEEATHFYDRYPHWSMLGKMVYDAQAAIDALENVPFVDNKRIFILGYSLGGMVGLHTAALDKRLSGVVSIAGFTPMRLDTVDKGTGGIARWSHWYVLQPKLGAFISKEKHIPYDYHEVLGLIAPRPLLIVSPKYDRENNLSDIKLYLNEVAKVYNLYHSNDKLIHFIPEDYNRYSPELQSIINNKLKTICKKMSSNNF